MACKMIIAVVVALLVGLCFADTTDRKLNGKTKKTVGEKVGRVIADIVGHIVGYIVAPDAPIVEEHNAQVKATQQQYVPPQQQSPAFVQQPDESKEWWFVAWILLAVGVITFLVLCGCCCFGILLL